MDDIDLSIDDDELLKLALFPPGTIELEPAPSTSAPKLQRIIKKPTMEDLIAASSDDPDLSLGRHASKRRKRIESGVPVNAAAPHATDPAVSLLPGLAPVSSAHRSQEDTHSAPDDTYFGAAADLQSLVDHSFLTADQPDDLLTLEDVVDDGLEAGDLPADPQLASEWNQRLLKWQQEASQRRPLLFQAVVASQAIPEPHQVCQVCASVDAKVRVCCKDCTDLGGSVLLCGHCDGTRHPYAHFHRRRSVEGGFLKPIPASHAYDDDGNVVHKDKYLGIVPEYCDNCHKHHTFTMASSFATSQQLIYILHGRHNFVKAGFKCSSCDHEQIQADLDFVSWGAWPATHQNLTTVVDIRLLQRWQSLKSSLPAVSVHGFLESLASEARQHGGEGSMHPFIFRRVYSEWHYCQTALRKEMRVANLGCMACGDTPHAVHQDANMKLVTENRGVGLWQAPSYYQGEDALYADDEEVQSHMEIIDLAHPQRRQAGDCTCNGHWEAAANSGKKHENKHYSGRIYILCRHMNPLGAVGLRRTGERYAYYNFLNTTRFLPTSVGFYHMDIACKFDVWCANVIKKVTNSTDPKVRASACYERVLRTKDGFATGKIILAEAHGRLHVIWCWMLYSPLWTPGACTQPGEECELYYSHTSKYSSTVRKMAPVTSQEVLTEAAMAWTDRKSDGLAMALEKRYKKTLERMKLADDLLADACRTILIYIYIRQPPDAAAFQRIMAMVADLKFIAREEVTKSSREISVQAQFFAVHQRLNAARLLDSFARVPVVGSHELSELQRTAGALSAEAEKLANELIRLRRKVVEQQPQQESATNEQLAQHAYSAVVEDRLQELQKAIEGHAAQISKHSYKVTHVADTSKERTRYNKKITEEAAKLRKLVNEYNELRLGGTKANADGTPYVRSAVDAELLLTAARSTDRTMCTEFPWVDEYDTDKFSSLRGIGLKAAVHLCECFLKTQRLKEEQAMLIKEMHKYMQYCRDRIAMSFELPAVTEPQAPGRYQLHSITDRTSRGVAALRLAGKHHHEQLLRKGEQHLQSILDSSKAGC